MCYHCYAITIDLWLVFTLLLLSCPSHNFFPLAGACLSPLCHCGQVVSRAGEEVFTLNADVSQCNILHSEGGVTIS